jgi:hypothetical protein
LPTDTIGTVPRALASGRPVRQPLAYARGTVPAFEACLPTNAIVGLNYSEKL